MKSRIRADANRRRIVVADEDPAVVALIIHTLREDGHAVFHAYDALSATELTFALDAVDLVITNTRVSGLPGVQLVYELRDRLPHLPMLYIANIDRSTPAIEAKLPRDVPVLREPFTPKDLRGHVNGLLAGERGLNLSVDRPSPN